MQILAPDRENHPNRYITVVKGAAAAVAMVALLVSCGGGGGNSNAPDEKRGDVKVTALFATHGAQWNDYVRGDVSTATDTACNAATDTACMHGGEQRVLVVTGKTSCSGLLATDDLGAFNWVCDGSRKPVRMLSTGLANGKFLSDLIDFTSKRFKPNKVTIKANGIVWIVTPSSVWWTNPIVENNAGGSLATASTVYLVTHNPAAHYSLDANRVALVVQPGVILTGPGTNGIVIFSNHHNVWLEGTLNATGEFRGVVLDSVRFSVLRNVAAANTDVGVVLNNASYNIVSSVTASNNANVGLALDGASNNTISGVTANNNTNHGVILANASNYNKLSGVTASNNASNGVTVANASKNNTISGVTASNNAVHGVLLVDAANNNRLSGVTASNNPLNGVTIANVSNNTLSGVTASNNSFGVFLVDGANNNTLSGVTASNNSDFGVLLTNASSNNTLVEVAASNNSTAVALAASSGNNTFSGVAASNNNTGIILSDTSNNRFTGLLSVGSNFGDCSVNGGTLPGLDPFSCANNGSSDATQLFGISLSGSFVGKVASDDTKNTNDTNGTATFPSNPIVFDWTHFDNTYRGWGIDGSAFPDALQRGSWSTGAGRIWDWSVSAGDAGANGSPSCTAPCPALLGVLALPTGNDTLMHIWNGAPGTLDNAGCDAMVAGSKWNGSACGTTFLRNAVEIPGKGGNENNLCESGETCLHSPNIGSYQGHSGLENAGIFIDGFLTGIRLMKYKLNGR